ncbi:hypothetical protein H0H81_011589 [Sphagnurus paluster]|uniref:CASTOR ACT domain-containing protein n=1 Tax=Sphagnurus paluster TaxID=117069 RepID=A0A9P7KLX1_9AGAR|nr:hypothetical protein H0H81_011589 [Sphagnurus paluster]
MQVTISLLPASLSLVHIPRSRLHALSHPILKQILRPDPTFLNITCNEVELSLFAEHTVLAEFEPIARRDRRRLRSRSSTAGTPRKAAHDIEPVEVSYERWSVLQIDSHNDQMDNSGARVNEVSAPLAAAGISILYQSSYMCDFILVKESRLRETMDLLAEAGFDIYTSGSESLPLAPGRPKDRSSIHDFRSGTLSPPPLTRARSGTDPTALQLDTKSVWDGYRDSIDAAATPPADAKAKARSSSLTADQIRVLSSELACVGLSEDLGADHWGIKIVKLVAFPELIPSRTALHPLVPSGPVTPVSLAPPLFPVRKPSTPLFDFSPPIDPHTQSQSAAASGSPLSDSDDDDDDDGYFSHSPISKSSASFVTPASRSHCELSETLGSSYKRGSRHVLDPYAQFLPKSASNEHAPPVVQNSRVPFFSYTRTSEGSSLTADVYVLAALFPPPERHMIICSGELDAADARITGSASVDALDDDDDNLSGNKYGFVSRFSQVLEENEINHMYSSTFKTANLLVDKKHAQRAHALLCDS